MVIVETSASSVTPFSILLCIGLYCLPPFLITVRFSEVAVIFVRKPIAQLFCNNFQDDFIVEIVATIQNQIRTNQNRHTAAYCNIYILRTCKVSKDTILLVVMFKLIEFISKYHIQSKSHFPISLNSSNWTQWNLHPRDFVKMA